MNYEWVKFEIKEKGKPEYTEKNLAEWGRKPTTAGIEPKSHCRETRLVLLPHNTTTITTATTTTNNDDDDDDDDDNDNNIKYGVLVAGCR